jgi:isoleucyl-tRNA synthetase
MVTLEIRWPFGKSETYKDLRVNRMVTIKEGTGIVHSAGWGDNEQILPSS